MTEEQQDRPEEQRPRIDYKSVRNQNPGNSKKQRSEQPKPQKLQKVVSEDVTQQKPPLGKRIMASLTGDDSRTVGNYILFEVAIPALKQFFSDAVTTAVDRFLFGGTHTPPSSSGVRRSYTPYNRYSTTTTPASRPGSPVAQQRDVPSRDDIIVKSRGDAEAIIEALAELIQAYDVASVADLMQLVGLTGNYTDDKWGWTSIAGARYDRVHDGFRLILPPARPLD